MEPVRSEVRERRGRRLAAWHPRVLVVLGLVALPAGASRGAAEPLFVEIAPAGIGPMEASWGGTFADLDGDGRLDLLVSDHGHAVVAHRNLGAWNFERVDTEWDRPEGLRDLHAIAAYDHDGDGDTDLYLTVGAERGRGRGTNQFWRAEGPGIYRDVASEHPLLQDPRGRGRGVTWIDLDGDSSLELLVGNLRRPAVLLTRRDDAWVRIDDRIRTTPDRAILPDWWLFATADLDRDGDTDLLAPSPAALVHLNEDGRLVDASERLGVHVPLGAPIGVLAGDVDGDDRPDVLLALKTSPWIVGWRNALGADPPRMLPVAREFVTFAPHETVRSATLADLDGDGRADLHLQRATRDGARGADVFLRGDGRGGFEDVSARWSEPARVAATPFAAAAVDLDADGDLDLVEFHERAEPTEGGSVLRFLENRGAGPGVTVRLLSRTGPPEGVGARVERLADDEDVVLASREVRFVGDPYSTFVAPVHFGGLAPAASVRLRVHWRTGGAQIVTLPTSGASYLVAEGEAEPRRVR